MQRTVTRSSVRTIDASQNDMPNGHVNSAVRPWLNLWLTVHFFALAVCLAANFASSELERRILKVLAPYTVLLHQNYGGVPLEMTRGTDSDFPHVFQVHVAGKPSDDWQTVSPNHTGLSVVDRRWSAFQRRVAVVAGAKDDDLALLLMERSMIQQVAAATDQLDGVRLVRRTSLSYAADRARVAGELPIEQLQDQTLYEYRLVHLDGERVKLLPVLESTRTSKSLLGERSTEVPPSTVPSTDNVPEAPRS